MQILLHLLLSNVRVSIYSVKALFSILPVLLLVLQAAIHLFSIILQTHGLSHLIVGSRVDVSFDQVLIFAVRRLGARLSPIVNQNKLADIVII